MLRRTTPMRLFWATDYSDYHPEEPGGSAAGRTCECKPFNTSMLGEYRARLRPGVMEATIPMPTTGADYRWMNLVARVPRKGIPTHRQAARARASAGCCWAGATPQAVRRWPPDCSPACCAPASESGRKPRWCGLTTDGDQVTGAVVEHDGREVTITARRGVVLAAGGFDHSMDMRWKFQSESLGEQPEPGRRDQHRRRDPHRPRGRCRNRSHGSGVVVPCRRSHCPAAAGGDAGRTVACPAR